MQNVEVAKTLKIIHHKNQSEYTCKWTGFFMHINRKSLNANQHYIGYIFL